MIGFLVWDLCYHLDFEGLCLYSEWVGWVVVDLFEEVEVGSVVG